MNKTTYNEFTQSIDHELIAAIPAAVVHSWITQGLMTPRQLEKYIKAVAYYTAQGSNACGK